MNNQKVKSFVDFRAQVLSDPHLLAELKSDPETVLNRIKEDTPLKTDAWIYRIVVTSLGTSVVSIIIGVIILIGKGEIGDDTDVPTILTALGSAAIGALAGLLAPSPRNEG